APTPQNRHPRHRRALPAPRGKRDRLRHLPDGRGGPRRHVDGGGGAADGLRRGRDPGRAPRRLLSAGGRGERRARPRPAHRRHRREVRGRRVARPQRRVAGVGQRGDHGHPRRRGARGGLRADHARPHGAARGGAPLRGEPPALPLALREQPQRRLLVRPGRHAAHRQPRRRGSGRVPRARPGRPLLLAPGVGRGPRGGAGPLRRRRRRRAGLRGDLAGAPVGAARAGAAHLRPHPGGGGDHRRVLHCRRHHRAQARRVRARGPPAARARGPPRGRSRVARQDGLPGRGVARAEDAAQRDQRLRGPPLRRRRGGAERHPAASPGAYPGLVAPSWRYDRRGAVLFPPGERPRRAAAAGRGHGPRGAPRRRRGAARRAREGPAALHRGAGRHLHRPHRPRPSAPPPAEPAQQRGEVHGNGRGARGVPPRGIHARGDGDGHGHRHRARAPGAHLGALLAGGAPPRPPRRRHRPGPQRRPPPRRADGRRHPGAQRARRGYGIHRAAAGASRV
ncbi:MAG: hypothetical protein AVDCRST_MAG68-4627, partial [uncultured Gemmatimonadetes bacterium]